MAGNTTAFDLGKAEKRHIVVGCGLHRIITPSLRPFVETTMQKAYNRLKSSNSIHAQTFSNHMKQYKGSNLNYGSINNNNNKHKAAKNKYDYRVPNHVDFAKLFLQPFMAHMTGFDDSCDMSALLGLLCNVADFSQDIRDAASDVRSEVRNKWGHCNLSDWTQAHFSRCFQLMEMLVKSLKLPSSAEQKCVQDLRDWKQRGVQLILGQVIDKDLLRVVQQDVAEMQSNLVKYKESSDSEVERLVQQLTSMKKVLAETEEKFEQGQATLRRDVNTIGESVTGIEGRVTTLEDGHGQVTEKVDTTVRSLTDFQQRQTDVNSTVDGRLQTLEKGQLEADVATSDRDTNQGQAPKRPRLDKKDTDERKNAFTSALAVKYNNALKTLKPLPWKNRFRVDLDQIFTRLELVGHRGITFKSLDDVFDHQPESGLSKRFNILVVGDAGSGKSTLFSKTALDWSRKKGRLADKIVLLIRLREVEPGESIAQTVWDQCVTKSAKGISISGIEACLQDYESDVVFLLDGYDELVPDAKGPKQAVPELLAKTWYPDCTVIVSSRPFADIERYMAVTREVNVMGFSSDHVDKYVPLYFTSVEKPGLADSLVKALDSRANVVARGLIQTPMFLMLICVLWEENPTIVQFPVTMSGLYWELLICVIRKYCVREGLPMSNDEIPPVVSAALLQLGKLALESLLRGESLVDLGEMTTNQDTDAMVNLGIVSKEVSASRLHPREQLNFPHKSMQEFLAARYVADRVNNSSGDMHTLVPLDTVSTVLEQVNLVQFICGCGGEATSELLANLNKLFVAESVSYSAGTQLKKAEEDKAYKHLCLMSLYEGHDSQHFPILSDVLSSLVLIIINIPSREGAALKYYLDHGVAVHKGRSLALTVADYTKTKGYAVEYLSTLVEKTIPDLLFYLTCSHYDYDGDVIACCQIGNKLDRLIPFLTNVPNMYSLNLAHTSLTPKSIQALRQILPKLAMLKELDLSNNPYIGFGDNEIDLLRKGLESNVRLENVNFSNVWLGDVSVKSLAAVLHHLSCLVKLDLSDNKIGDKGKEPFAAIQQPVASLKELDLSHNKIGDVCLGSLAAVLHHLSCLEELDLSDNNIGDDGLEPFAAIQQPVASLKVLNLSRNNIGDVCLGSLVAVLHHLSCLEELNLHHNNIGDEGLEPFAAIQQPVASLKVLYLSFNKIGDVCLGSLVAVLHHLSCLTHLSLSLNNIGDAEVEPLAATLHHVPSLKGVDLDDNPVTAVGLQRFAETIHRMPELEELSLTPQQTAHLDDTAAMSICTMLARLPVLEVLGLMNISMQATGFQAVITAAEEQPTLQELTLSRKCVPPGVNISSPKIGWLFW
ncbi:uncharacterized protein LOC144921635 [Branchiostoma floridae x Branchiostoma belcheri]